MTGKSRSYDRSYNGTLTNNEGESEDVRHSQRVRKEEKVSEVGKFLVTDQQSSQGIEPQLNLTSIKFI